MKKTLFSTLAALLIALPAFGQVSLIPTTLASAITSSQTNIQLAAVTGLNSNSYAIAAQTSYLYADGELMAVNSVGTSCGSACTNLSVTRGYGGSQGRAHVSGALVFVGPSTFFSADLPGLQPATGSGCTRSNFPAVPRPDVQTQNIFDCIGGVVVQGITSAVPQYEIPFPDSGAVTYTGVGSGSAGTAAGATTLYCTEVNLTYNKFLTGMAMLNGGTAATGKWIYALYDSAGNLLANTAVAGTVATGTNAFQKIAFTSKYYAVGPAKYFGCMESNAGGSITFTAIVTGMQDTYLTKGQTGTTFGTLPALTVPTTFTTAVGPYWLLY